MSNVLRKLGNDLILRDEYLYKIWFTNSSGRPLSLVNSGSSFNSLGATAQFDNIISDVMESLGNVAKSASSALVGTNVTNALASIASRGLLETNVTQQLKATFSPAIYTGTSPISFNFTGRVVLTSFSEYESVMEFIKKMSLIESSTIDPDIFTAGLTGTLKPIIDLVKNSGKEKISQKPGKAQASEANSLLDSATRAKMINVRVGDMVLFAGFLADSVTYDVSPIRVFDKEYTPEISRIEQDRIREERKTKVRNGESVESDPPIPERVEARGFPEYIDITINGAMAKPLVKGDIYISGENNILVLDAR